MHEEACFIASFDYQRDTSKSENGYIGGQFLIDFLVSDDLVNRGILPSWSIC